jgi:hypothetical protein
VSVNVTFHYIFNGNERSSQVQWIVDMF